MLRVDLPRSGAVRLEQAAPVLTRAVVAGVVIALSATLGPRLSLGELVVFGVGVVGVVGTIALARWPGLGLFALVVACVVVPFSIATGTETSVNAGIICLVGLGGLWSLEMLWRKEARLRFSRPLVPLFALDLTATLSFALGIRPEEPFAQTAPLQTQVGALAVFWLSALAFAIAGHRLPGVRWIRALTWLFVVLGAVYVAGRLVPPLAPVVPLFQDGAAYSLFYVWLVAFSIGQAAFNRQLRSSIRLALAGLTLATLYLGFFLQRDWSSGWVPPLVAIVVVLCVGAPKIGVPLAALATGLGALAQTAISGVVLNSNKDWDILTREAAWSTLLPVMQINPILGVGPANYFWYTPLYPILGYSVHFNSHNNYVDLVLQTGVVGLCCFLWFAVELGALGWRLRNRVAPGFERAYVCAVLGAMAGTLVAGALGDWFLPFVYNIRLTGLRSSLLGWMFLGSLLVFERRSLGRSSEAMMTGRDRATASRRP